MIRFVPTREAAVSFMQNASGAQMSPEEIFVLFDERELTILSLLALGWHEASIASYVKYSRTTVNNAISKCGDRVGLGRAGLALFYVDHLLPFDTRGYKAPGEKLVAWRGAAEKRREQLKGAKLAPSVFESVAVAARIDRADLPVSELRLFMRTRPSVNTYKGYLSQAAVALRSIVEAERARRIATGKNPGGSLHGRGQLFTVARLAPFDELF